MREIKKDLNPIEQAEYINEEYKKYLRDSFSFNNKYLDKQFNDILMDEKLLNGPYLAMDLPFKKGLSIKELIDQGKLHRDFRNIIEEQYMNRPLYLHQQEAIEKIAKNRNIVITTGTGSGKTECFLYPILSRIMADIEKGNEEPGVRAIFLYPMNALVNDQRERIAELLKNYPQITYGIYTGDTPESSKKVNKSEDEVYINELCSREDMRESPPHLLFTNYSMLEHLLIRPYDDKIFSPDFMKNWRFLVLDEAHTYSGAKGIEISYLLKRLCAFANRKPQFMLTSATLGTKGESEKDIIDFAKRLTSSSFAEEDIIFSTREHVLNSDKPYIIKGKDYLELINNLNDIDKLKVIANKYIRISEDDIDNNGLLFKILQNDGNVFELYTILKKAPVLFTEIERKLKGKLEKQEIISLINLISNSEYKGNRLFDIKYHSFIRPLSGGYINLATEDARKLVLRKTDVIDDLKSFEIGVCKNCNNIYIIGKIRKNTKDNLYYLLQNKEIDIYENYGENEVAQLDYFILNNDNIYLDDENKIEEKLEKYIICSKCGSIRLEGNIKGKKCNCGEMFEKKIFRLVNESDSSANNITHCPYCGYIKNNGVVKDLTLGKDETTAIIGQLLYEAIEKSDIEEIIVNDLATDLFGIIEPSEKRFIKVPKQYITFSDSRQQASFSAMFFSRSYERILRKRLIWEILAQNNYEEMPVNKLKDLLQSKINEESLFDSELTSDVSAWIAILVDLLKVDGRNDGEGLGLYYFDLKLDCIDIIKDYTKLRQKYNIKNKKDLANLIQIIINVFKKAPAIKYTDAVRHKGEDYLGYRRFLNGVKIQKTGSENDKYNNIRSLLPAGNREENALLRYIMKACKCTNTDAKDLIRKIIKILETYKLLIIEKNGAYRVSAENFIIKCYKTNDYYKCNICGEITPYNLNNACTKDKCNGLLEKISPDEELKNNYYRNQYKYRNIEPIRIEEHTAQLNKEEAKLIQKQFKNKEVNILSCSTTFEMGIDIGGLDTVFMRNVPPSPSNYVQRAGRAGRKKGSVPFVLTFCDNSSHDYTYFNEPNKMIKGIIEPPYFNLLNKKILMRHIMATCLGLFFKRNKESFKTLSSFIVDGAYMDFITYLKSRPEEVDRVVNRELLSGDEYVNYQNYKWLEAHKNPIEIIDGFAKKVLDQIKEYENLLNDKDNEKDRKFTSEIDKQLTDYKGKNLLHVLSDHTIIPKYGFPIDLVRLDIIGDYLDSYNNTSPELERDLSIAIYEYAPDSEVIVQKNKYRSRYINFPKKNNDLNSCPLPFYFYVKCDNCGTENLYKWFEAEKKCKCCNKIFYENNMIKFIKPKEGFSAELVTNSGHLKPKRSYVGEVKYLGDGNKANGKHKTFPNLGIEIITSSDDKLLILNRFDFYMCEECGYAEVLIKKNNRDEKKQKHNNKRGRECKNKVLKKIHLGHTFRTDIARIKVEALDATKEYAKSKAYSFMYALLQGISETFDIERKDLNCLLQKDDNEEKYDILIYDNVPGGAGHIKRILDENRFIQALEAARKKVSQDCCDENTSCYKCLRDYYNQAHHDKLRRKYAIEVIDNILKKTN